MPAPAHAVPTGAFGRRLLLGAVCLLVLLALSPVVSARAGVRTGAVTFAAPRNPPSLTPLPPATEQGQYLERVSVAYDDRAGELTATARLFSPQVWGLRLPSVKLVLGTSECTTDEDGIVNGSDADLTLVMSSAAYEIGTGSTDLFTAVTRSGYESRAEGTLTFDGSTFTATVRNPGLAGVEARCLVVKELGSNSIDLGVWLRQGNLSYAPIDLNRRTAERAMRAALRARFGDAWTNAGRSYLKCSPHDWDDEQGGRSTPCMARFGHGRRWTHVNWIANAAENDYRVRMDGKPYTVHWTRRWHRNSAACLRTWRVSGTVWSNSGGCAAHLVSNYWKGVMWSGGAGSGDFPALFRYPCRRHGGVLVCTNAVGDSVRWRR